jgi:hypothetical protein
MDAELSQSTLSEEKWKNFKVGVSTLVLWFLIVRISGALQEAVPQRERGQLPQAALPEEAATRRGTQREVRQRTGPLQNRTAPV